MKFFFRQKINEIALYPESLLKNYLQKIAKDYNTSFETLYLHSIGEIYKISEGFRLTEEKMQERATEYAMYYDGVKFSYLSGKEGRKVIERIHKEAETGSEIKGIIANKGKITAKARVLEYTLEDFGKTEGLIRSMKKGEVLVTETTGPEIIEACNKAAAIVTDEGGLLSHAAIISRELRIPCIVGTKFSTSMIKTGDLIEVDANKGIIKIIK